MRKPAQLPIAIAALAALALPTPLIAQEPDDPVVRRSPDGFRFTVPRVSLAVRGGFNRRSTGSDIYDFVTENLTVEPSDFNTFSLGGELGVRIAQPVDLVFGAGYGRTTTASEFRHYVDQDDLPITQRTTLSTTPLTVALRWYLTPRGRQVGRFAWIPERIVPYVGVGVGAVRYTFEQSGSFVDFQDLSIFSDRFESEGWTLLGLAMAGAEYNLSPLIFLSVDARYHLANADLHQDFVDFTDGIDLSGLQLSLGLHLRI